MSLRMRYCHACQFLYTENDLRTLNLKMHFFPRKDWQQNFLMSWLSFCGMPLLTKDLRNKFICSKHFDADDYFPGANRRLRLDAVPHLCPPKELVADGDMIESISRKPPQKKNLYDLGRREMLGNVKKQVCRLCGKREGKLSCIFGESSEEATIPMSMAAKIRIYLPVKIEDDEFLPLNICKKCSDLLNRFHDLTVTCVAVDKILRKTFGVDESDALFEDPEERVQEQAQESKSFKQQLQKTVAQVIHEHNSILETITKTMEAERNAGVGAPGSVILKRKQFMCAYCGEGFRHFKARMNHINTCRELPGICEVCGKLLPRKELKRHLSQSHSIPKDYMCDKCAKCFRSLHTLQYHVKTKHEITSDIKYYCELCCKTFCTKLSYEGHLQCHESGNINLIFNIDTKGLDEDSIVFKCPVCETIFEDKVTLIVHLNAPADMKCDNCLSHFHCEKSYLVHQSADKWMCQHCEKVFCYKHHVVAHERIHTWERPFKCMLCDLRFRTHMHKMKHQAVHHRPQYKCTYCDRNFRYKGRFEDHINFHVGNVISCNICKKQFGGMLSLCKHTQRYHKQGGRKRKNRTQSFEPQALEIEPQDLEINPQDLEMNPQDVEMNPQDLQMNSQVLDFESQILEIEPQTLEIVSQALDITPQILEITPQSLEMAQQSLEIAPQTLGIAPQSLGIAPQTLEIAQQTLEIAPQSLEITQQALDIEPQILTIDAQTLEINAQALGIDVQTLELAQTLGLGGHTLELDAQTLDLCAQSLDFNTQNLEFDGQSLGINAHTIDIVIQPLGIETQSLEIGGL